jgi:collagenase-like PrtC family protease
MKLSLGPIAYYWPREQVLDFYRQVNDSPLDIVYLGEIVCSKRRQMRTEDWFELADSLQQAGKQVVLSTLALTEADSELKSLQRICGNSQYMVEANDMSAVGLLEGKSFCSGVGVNIYNQQSLVLLARLGLKRWLMPVELGFDTLEDMQAQRPDGVETEIFGFGRLPLAWSARCFTARAHNLPKDDCQYRCLEYPDGMLLNTQEGQGFLNVNGIQTQSAQTFSLIDQMDELQRMGIDVFRINPQSTHMDKIVQTFRDCLNGQTSTTEAMKKINPLVPHGMCNGYWHGIAGMKSLSS